MQDIKSFLMLVQVQVFDDIFARLLVLCLKKQEFLSVCNVLRSKMSQLSLSFLLSVKFVPNLSRILLIDRKLFTILCFISFNLLNQIFEIFEVY